MAGRRYSPHRRTVVDHDRAGAAMMPVASLLLCLAAFAVLAMSPPRHHRDVLGTTPAPRRERSLKGLGWALLSLSPVPLTIGTGISIGIAFWFGTTTLAALLIAIILAYRPRLLVPVGVSSVPLALAAFCLSRGL
ncbi:MAG: DUF3325 domain-containing protein [Novosphingobium sp.]|nr:DUF3325 domain-containing protein [Novosphingobium sp.]